MGTTHQERVKATIMWAHAGHSYLTILLYEPIHNIYTAWAQVNELLKQSILTTIQYITEKGLLS